MAGEPALDGGISDYCIRSEVERRRNLSQGTRATTERPREIIAIHDGRAPAVQAVQNDQLLRGGVRGACSSAGAATRRPSPMPRMRCAA